MPSKTIYNLLFSLLLLCGLSFGVKAEEPPHEASESSEAVHSDKEAGHEEKGGFNPGEVIMEHITDSHEWHFGSYKGDPISVPLPLILFSPGKGLSIFSYSRFHHGHESYNGYKVVDRKIVAEDGSKVYDFSLTKNVVQMLIGVLLLLWIMLSVARNYKKYGTKAPRGMTSVVEVIVIFIRDQVAKPMLGDKYMKYLPYLLTLFFFIWINNLLGLFPGAANVTGNIAVTATLALITFHFDDGRIKAPLLEPYGSTERNTCWCMAHSDPD
jgi:F-type H+-transporting ATPase subunit a